MGSLILYFVRIVGFLLVLLMSVQVEPITACDLVQSYYGVTCPKAEQIVQTVVAQRVKEEPRIAASLLRLFFHDCFATGCDASVLLDNSSTIVSEKYARPNINTLRGFQVIDEIKQKLEESCSETVSCADILALSARDSVFQTGGPYYEVLLGRRDSIIANYTAANTVLPSPTFNVSALSTKFAAVGLSEVDMVTLSGAHTIGKAHCSSITKRLFNQSASEKPDPNIPPELLKKLQTSCPQNAADTTTKTVQLDDVTPDVFDNQYYKNLLNRQGILYSDEILSMTSGYNVDLVTTYATDQNIFFDAFVKSITKMGNISPLTGTDGEIRRKCHEVNN